MASELQSPSEDPEEQHIMNAFPNITQVLLMITRLDSMSPSRQNKKKYQTEVTHFSPESGN